MIGSNRGLISIGIIGGVGRANPGVEGAKTGNSGIGIDEAAMENVRTGNLGERNDNSNDGIGSSGVSAAFHVGMGLG
eukprot:CAMPEP_0170564782 /NCGR_PEP_ID=MMETSP0211-20121228/74913_1 /TAXON_ID=311385 /ORGANISM="Pseudokeronopsis sp., Strain OXSARD2" /LENGTH=76 /DNA_ID=CAMNT_0010884697 /DNA_START=76 /DNA_END=302 /DNA_ORIENTATION=-